MDSIEAIHTATRRYCIDRAAMWRKHASRPDRAPMQDRRHPEIEREVSEREGRLIYPSICLLEAVLEEVERFVPGDFTSPSETLELLLVAVQTADREELQRLDRAQVQETLEERDQLLDYLKRLTEADLRLVEPLPFRRRLSPGEAGGLWDRISERWGIREQFWYPLSCKEPPPGVVALQADWFYHAIPLASLRALLTDRGITRVWELREDGRDYELAMELLEPWYTGLEGFWFADTCDWLIYASHESSITLAGQWLIDAVQSLWPAWHEHIYDGWEYEGPPPASSEEIADR
jgi:hypothetical protein